MVALRVKGVWRFVRPVLSKSGRKTLNTLNVLSSLASLEKEITQDSTSVECVSRHAGGRGHRAWSMGQRAEGMGQRAEGKDAGY